MVAQSIAVQVGYALVWEWDYINELDLVWELDIQNFGASALAAILYTFLTQSTPTH